MDLEHQGSARDHILDLYLALGLRVYHDSTQVRDEWESEMVASAGECVRPELDSVWSRIMYEELQRWKDADDLDSEDDEEEALEVGGRDANEAAQPTPEPIPMGWPIPAQWDNPPVLKLGRKVYEQTRDRASWEFEMKRILGWTFSNEPERQANLLEESWRQILKDETASWDETRITREEHERQLVELYEIRHQISERKRQKLRDRLESVWRKRWWLVTLFLFVLGQWLMFPAADDEGAYTRGRPGSPAHNAILSLTVACLVWAIIEYMNRDEKPRKTGLRRILPAPVQTI